LHKLISQSWSKPEVSFEEPLCATGSLDGEIKTALGEDSALLLVTPKDRATNLSGTTLVYYVTFVSDSSLVKTNPSSVESTKIVSFSLNSPSRILLESGFSTWCWIALRRGRAPYVGS